MNLFFLSNDVVQNEFAPVSIIQFNNESISQNSLQI